MLASEYIMAKAIEHDDFRLNKIAQELHESEHDVIVKTAGPLTAGVGMAAKALFKNTTIRNAAIGTGVGAIGGAATAEEGGRLRGALKGAALGGAVGGVGTAGWRVGKNMNAGMGFGKALKAEGTALKDTVTKAVPRGYDRGVALGKIQQARKAAVDGQKTIAAQSSLQGSMTKNPNSFTNAGEGHLRGRVIEPNYGPRELSAPSTAKTVAPSTAKTVAPNVNMQVNPRVSSPAPHRPITGKAPDINMQVNPRAAVTTKMPGMNIEM